MIFLRFSSLIQLLILLIAFSRLVKSIIQSLKSIQLDNKFYIYTVDTYCNVTLTIIHLPEALDIDFNNQNSTNWQKFPSEYLLGLEKPVGRPDEA